MTNYKDVEEGKLVAILSYFLVGIIWFFADEKMKKNEFVKFHVKQSLVLLIFSVIVWVIQAIVSVIITAIAVVTFGLGSVLFVIPMLIGLIPLIFWIFGLIYSIQGVEKEIPLIGKFEKNFTF